MFKGFSPKASTKSSGDAAEDRTLRNLQQRGLRLVERNYRVASGPSARGGAIDTKQRPLLLAAQHHLLRCASALPGRFDVLALDGQATEWFQAAFDASL